LALLLMVDPRLHGSIRAYALRESWLGTTQSSAQDLLETIGER